MKAKCAVGYQGPLCAVCSKGFYRLASTCQKCPTLPWLIGQVVIVVLVTVIIIGSLSLGKKKRTLTGRSATDILLARLKIVIGFYQVTSGTLTSFSYISWPNALLQVLNFAKVVQLNLLQIVPLHCFNNQLQVDAYSTLAVFVAVNVVGVALLVFEYNVKTFCANRRQDVGSLRGKRLAMFAAKEHCYKYSFLLMFLTYPALAAQVLQMLPQACKKICMDIRGTKCEQFLMFDYSVKCYTSKYDSFVVLVYLLLLFVIGFPLVTLFLLWRNQSQMKEKNGGRALTEQHDCEQQPDSEPTAEGTKETPRKCDSLVSKELDFTLPETGSEISQGMRFLYENYTESCWFWEVVELARKVILTSALALVGAESRTSLGVAALVSGFYSVVFAQYKPISDSFEYWLQLASLAATSVNMNVGMLLKIPTQEVTSSTSSQLESVLVTVLLVFNNVLVIVMMLGK